MFRNAFIFVVALISCCAVAAPPSVPGGAGGFGDPLRIRNVKLVFGFGDFGQPRQTIKPGEGLKGFSATFFYKGAGTVTGRWEVVRPGETSPSPQDRLVDYAVPLAERSQLTKYRVLETFLESFGPTGRHVIAGPDSRKLPCDQPGTYKILLRIESISSSASTNPAQPGLVLPMLQYTILGGESPVGHVHGAN